MAVERVAVDRHFRIEQDYLAIGIDDQRIDLDQSGVFLAGDFDQFDQNRGDLIGHFLRDARAGDDVPGVTDVKAFDRVDVLPDQSLGIGLGDRLNIHAAHPGEHHQQFLL